MNLKKIVLSDVLLLSLFFIILNGGESKNKNKKKPRKILTALKTRRSSGSCPGSPIHKSDSAAEANFEDYLELKKGQFLENVKNGFLPLFNNQDLNKYILDYNFDKHICSKLFFDSVRSTALKLFEKTKYKDWQFIFLSAFLLNIKEYKKLYVYTDNLEFFLKKYFFGNIIKFCRNCCFKYCEESNNLRYDILDQIKKAKNVANNEEIPAVSKFLDKIIHEINDTSNFLVDIQLNQGWYCTRS